MFLSFLFFLILEHSFFFLLFHCFCFSCLLCPCFVSFLVLSLPVSRLMLPFAFEGREKQEEMPIYFSCPSESENSLSTLVWVPDNYIAGGRLFTVCALTALNDSAVETERVGWSASRQIFSGCPGGEEEYKMKGCYIAGHSITSNDMNVT